MARLVATVDSESITEHPDGSITYTCKAAVDADGSAPNTYGDPDWQPATSLRVDGKSLDATTVPYGVVPGELIKDVRGVVLGCMGFMIYRGRCTPIVAGDVGPVGHLGEFSEKAIANVGLDPSPLHGGTDAHVIHVVWYPGIPAVIDGITYPLQPSSRA